MKTIWKYELRPELECIEMPASAQILCVQVQNGEPCLWALVDTCQKETMGRRFGVYGTGHNMPDDPGAYVGTFQLNGGALVFHVFEKKP